ncbi:hypothetical protein CBR_g24111 [Chara braunii]|uniref:Myb-like domain-containing protein n=1 Tax=Chara braunii TaxID=69332 RepID=A0A388L5T8_CHABU|nr:hypothetical protein CBR_g24111 [Chara braunii]|eukprot:GBG77665.1 hypothetical protein CBR_g24111 [Chara braunii]
MGLSCMTSDPEIWAQHATQSPAHMRLPVTFASGMDALPRPVPDLGTCIRPPPSAAVGGIARGPVDSTRIPVAPGSQPSQGASFIPPPAPAYMQPHLVDRLRTVVVDRAWANLRTVGGGVAEDVQRMRQGVGVSLSARDHGDMADRCSPRLLDVAGRPRRRGSVGGRVPESGSEVDINDDATRPEGGEVPGRRRTRPWLQEERIDLARFMKEDSAMMQMALGRLKHARRPVRNKWVSKKMKAAGWIRSAEDCRKKWCDLMSKMKDILRKCNASGKPSYWEMSVENRKREGIPTTFEQPLWEEMEWAHRKPPVACDNTMASSNLQGAESGVSDKETPSGHDSSEGESRSGASAEKSEGLRKKRRGATGKERASGLMNPPRS